MREISMNVYKFEELSEEAKEVAREWWREDLSAEFEMIQQDAKHFLEEKFNIKVEGNVYWSDPYSQGYHAYFDTGYFKDDWEILKLALDKDEYDFLVENTEEFDIYTVNIKASDRSYHYTVNDYDNLEYSIYTENEELEEKLEDILQGAGDKIKLYLQDTVSRWLNKYIRESVDYWMMEDEGVDEVITINGYEFYENGKIYK